MVHGAKRHFEPKGNRRLFVYVDPKFTTKQKEVYMATGNPFGYMYTLIPVPEHLGKKLYTKVRKWLLNSKADMFWASRGLKYPLCRSRVINIITLFGKFLIEQNIPLHSKRPTNLLLNDPIHITYLSI